MKPIILRNVTEETPSYFKARIEALPFKSVYVDVYYMYIDSEDMWQGYDPYKDVLVFLNTYTFADGVKHFRQLLDTERFIRSNYI